MESFEYVGLWWLPEQSQEASCHGTLSFNGNSPPKLTLAGSLRPLTGPGIGSDEPLAPEIILGFTENGKAVTLYRCIETNSTLSYPGIPKTIYSATYAIIGSHLRTNDQVRFERFWIRYDRLVEWTQLTGFSEALHMEGNELRGITVDWRTPASVQSEISGWRIKFASGFYRRGDRLEHYNLENHLALEVVPPEPKSIDEFYLEFANHYRNFITLGVGSPVHTSDLRAEPIADRDSAHSDSSRSHIFHSSSRKSKPSAQIHEFKMLFSLRALGEEYPTCLQHWFSRADLLQPVFNLAFGTLYSEPGYMETEFLILAQALESYHRRIIGGAILGQDFEPVKQALLETIARQDLGITADARAAYSADSSTSMR